MLQAHFPLTAESQPVALNNILSIKALRAKVKSTLEFYGDWALGTACGGGALCFGGSWLQDCCALRRVGVQLALESGTRTSHQSVAGLRERVS